MWLADEMRNDKYQRSYRYQLKQLKNTPEKIQA